MCYVVAGTILVGVVVAASDVGEARGDNTIVASRNPALGRPELQYASASLDLWQEKQVGKILTLLLLFSNNFHC